MEGVEVICMAYTTNDLKNAEQLIQKVIYANCIGRTLEICCWLLSLNLQDNHEIKCYQTFGKRPDIRFCIDRGSDCDRGKIMTNFLVIEPNFEIMGLYLKNPTKYSYLKPNQKRWRINSKDTSVLPMSNIIEHIYESYCLKLKELGLNLLKNETIQQTLTNQKAIVFQKQNYCHGEILIAQHLADDYPVFTNRGTGGSVPLKSYGRPGTFGLTIAEKLATTGITEAEYVQIAQRFGTSQNRFKAYIEYFKGQGFNIISENGRYVEKNEPSNVIDSSTQTQSQSYFETAERFNKLTEQIKVTVPIQKTSDFDEYEDIKI